MPLRNVLFLLAVTACLPLAGCTQQQLDKLDTARDVARSVTDMARALCFSAHAKQLGVDPAKLKDTVCSTVEDLEPFRRAILGAQREGSIAAGLAQE